MYGNWSSQEDDKTLFLRILCLKRVFESSFWSVVVELVYLIQLLFENLHVKCEDHVLLKVLNKNLL